MIAQIERPTPGFEEVIHTHFYLKQKEILQQCKAWKLAPHVLTGIETALAKLEKPSSLP